MKIAFITDRPFWLQEGGSQKRIADFIRHCREKHEVEVIFIDPPAKFSARVPEQWNTVPIHDLKKNLPFSKILFFWRRARKKLWTILAAKKLVSNESAWIFDCSVLHARVAARLAQMGGGLVLLEYLSLADAIRSMDRTRWHVIADSPDVNYQRHASLSRMGDRNSPGIFKEEEARILNRFDAVIAIQRNEAKAMREMVPDKPVLTVGVSGHLKRMPSSRNLPFRVLYCGSYNSVNAMDLQAFVDTVWKPLVKSHPEAELAVTGGVCDMMDPGLSKWNVRLLGTVQNLEEQYLLSRAVVNPARAGSGLKTKCVEALGYGKALLTTPVGMDGMEDGEGKAFGVYRHPEEAMAWLNRASTEPAFVMQWEESAWNYALEKLSKSTVYAEFDSYVAELNRRNHFDAGGNSR